MYILVVSSCRRAETNVPSFGTSHEFHLFYFDFGHLGSSSVEITNDEKCKMRFRDKAEGSVDETKVERIEMLQFSLRSRFQIFSRLFGVLGSKSVDDLEILLRYIINLILIRSNRNRRRRFQS